MIDILLVNPWCNVTWIGEPLGLGYIAAVLEENNFKVKILDLHSILMGKQKFLSLLKRERPSIVGISTHTPSFLNSLKIAEVVKQYDNCVQVVMGGPHATFTSRQILLRNKNIDMIIRNEGEYTFKEVAECLINGKGSLDVAKGLTFRKKSEIVVNPEREFLTNLDELPFPARHLIIDFPKRYNKVFDKTYKTLDEFFKKRGFEYPRKLRAPNISIVTGRGCPFKCSFCATITLGKYYRVRSVENVLEEISYCIEKYGAKYIDFVDDTFVVYRNRLQKMCSLLKEHLPDGTYWCCNGRINLMTKDILKQLSQSGCDNVTYGIESADETVLKHMNKAIEFRNIEPVINNTVKENISVYLSFIIGYPTETLNEIRKTIEFAKKMLDISELVFVSFNPWTPMVGAPIYQMKKELHIKYLYDEDFRYPGFTAFETPHINSTDVWKIFRYELDFDYRKNIDVEKRINLVSSVEKYNDPILVSSCIDLPLNGKVAVKPSNSKKFLVLKPLAKDVWPYLMNGYYTLNDILRIFSDVPKEKILEVLNGMARRKIIGVDRWNTN